MLGYIAYELKPITRQERAEARKNAILRHYHDPEREFLEFVLGTYVQSGVEMLDTTKLADLLEVKYHSLSDAAQNLGGIDHVRETFEGFQEYLYTGEG